MPTLRLEGSLAAATTDGNLLADSKFVQLPFPASIYIYAVQDGADAGDVTIDWTLGDTIEIDSAAVPTYTANQGPDTNKHLLASAVAKSLDRQTLRLVNADAANASAYRILVVIKRIA